MLCQGSFLRDFWQLLLKRLGRRGAALFCCESLSSLFGTRSLLVALSTRSEDLTVTTSSLLRVLVDPEAKGPSLHSLGK